MTSEVKVDRRPIEKLGYCQRLISWYREKTIGYPMAGYYDSFPFTKNKIVIANNMPKELEEAVVKHERNHHKQRTNSEVFWTTKGMWIGILGLLPAIYFNSELLSGISVLTIASMAVIERFYVSEKDANDDVDWDSVEESLNINGSNRIEKYFEYFLYVVLAIPGNIELQIRDFLYTAKKKNLLEKLKVISFRRS